MSDYFKTLREPLLEQQKKTDAKQDAMINQLKENQLALTSGVRELVDSNRDVLTLQQELPFPSIEEKEKKEKSVIYQLNNRFSRNDFEILNKYNLQEPDRLVKFQNKDLVALAEDVKKERKKILNKIGSFVRRTRAKTQVDYDEYDKNILERETLNKYLNTIDNVLDLSLYEKKGEGIRKYKQPKRNAYKISNSSYGNLSVDLPKLKNEMKLNVRREGKKIYQADADRSLVDFLTKRFNPKKSYSMNAVKIFNDLNLLANLPKHPSSEKSRLIGSGVVYYNDPDELAERMKILVGSMAAGNNSPVLRNDLSMIIDEFLKIEAINKTTHQKFYDKYLK